MTTADGATRHIEVDSQHDANLFFWFFENRHIANKQRTVIWLNGGPGCSSLDGAMMEIGPYRVGDNARLELNNGSWDEFANVLFVDNPVGTGFSYVDSDSYLHELSEMRDHFLIFLEKWFALFPQYQQDDVPSAHRLRSVASTLTEHSFTLPANRTPASIFPTSRAAFSIAISTQTRRLGIWLAS